MIAAVALPLKVKSVDRLFDYLVPTGLDLQVGQAVEVPFAHRQTVGFVVALRSDEKGESENGELKTLTRAIPSTETFSLTAELLALAQFLRERYLCSWGAAIQTVLPPVTRARVNREYLLLNPAGDLPPEVLKYFARRQAVAKKTLQDKFALPDAVLARAVAEGTLGVRDKIAARVRRTADDLAETTLQTDKAVAMGLYLTPSQQQALERILAGVRNGEFRPFLLHGVTGSGKTEIYLRAIAQVVADGKQALMLVPEISLTAQLTARFRAQFGERMAVLHSRLTEREKYIEWRRILQGEAAVVIGARSAVFAPIPRLGIAILDEEHETSYKQEKEPPYLTREVAAWRAERHRAVLVLGSATPSLEAMYRARVGRYELLSLPQRVADRPLATVNIVNMREELKAGHRSLFSRPLSQALTEVLQRGEQAILFLNRRGYATFLQCRDCGHTVVCPDCDITLTLHKKGSGYRLLCHFCGHSEPAPHHCPVCGSESLRPFGTGTQRVEHDLLRDFPGVRVIRMDVDTTRQKGAHERMLGEFANGQADVLLGTQMIAKGLDFERVSLVGVIAADTSLFLPDLRAAERTFQLLVQVAGRAGRHQLPGRMIVQTFSPEHYAIKLAADQDYLTFYDTEMSARKAVGYPPFTEIAQFMVAHKEDTLARQYAESLFEDLMNQLGSLDGVRVLSPVPAAVTRVRAMYRYQLLVIYKSFRLVRSPLYECYQRLLKVVKADTIVTADVNVYGFY